MKSLVHKVWGLHFTVAGITQATSQSFVGLKLFPEIKSAHRDANLLSGIPAALKGCLRRLMQLPRVVSCSSRKQLKNTEPPQRE